VAIEFPFRKIPNRQSVRMAADFIPEADMSKVEACIVCFRRISEVYQLLEANLSRFGLSFARLGILAMLHCGGDAGMTPSELADEGGIARATVTGLLDGLEKEGLVERIKHPEDRRVRRVHFTDKGRELVAAALPAHFERVAGLLGNLTELELKQLTALMDKIGAGSPPAT
jgi:DNA-binding MarR family transcriptional regulator